jgi:hypothetical protein
MTQTPITADPELVSFCGQYCGACAKYRDKRCPGCRKNYQASWCHVRTCAKNNQYASCADCRSHQHAAQCRTFNHPLLRLPSRLAQWDRAACIAQIKAQGYAAYAFFMAKHRQRVIYNKK